MLPMNDRRNGANAGTNGGTSGVLESSQPLRLLLTSAEAAKALNIGERTLWRLTDDGEIPAIRIGRSVRYAVEDLQAWIALKRNPPLNAESSSLHSV